MTSESEGSGTTEPALLRISDVERHQVAELLRESAGEGRLDLEELDQRLEATYAARTYADLAPIVRDLPGAPATPGGSVPAVPYAGAAVQAGGQSGLSRIVAGPPQENYLAIMGSVERTGVWVVPRKLNVFALMGGAKLDLRQAKFAGREVTITINCLMGGAEIEVGPDVHVVVDGVGIMGAFVGPRGDADEAGPDSPVVHVRGVAIMGGVEVKRTEPDLR